jgi:hypothetical protein
MRNHTLTAVFVLALAALFALPAAAQGLNCSACIRGTLCDNCIFSDQGGGTCRFEDCKCFQDHNTCRSGGHCPGEEPPKEPGEPWANPIQEPGESCPVRGRIGAITLFTGGSVPGRMKIIKVGENYSIPLLRFITAETTRVALDDVVAVFGQGELSSRPDPGMWGHSSQDAEIVFIVGQRIS